MKSEIGHIMSLIQTLQPGQSFFVHCDAKTVTRYASLYQKKVKTERIISIADYSSDKPNADKLTKVTIL